MQWRKGNHREQKMHSEVLPGVLQRSCSTHCWGAAHHLKQYRTQVYLCANLCSEVTLICSKQLPLFLSVPDVSFSLSASYWCVTSSTWQPQCSHSPLRAAWALFPFTFPYTLLQLTPKILTKPEARWALAARGSIAVQNPGKHQVLNVSQQHQHLPPHLACQGCYFQIF